MSAIVSPKVFVSGVEKAPAVVTPHVYISAIEKSPAFVTPRVFISAVPKDPAIIVPRVYVASVPKSPAFITPRVFIAAIDSREVATADTLRRISNPSWQGEETATADTLRNLLDITSADTLRIIEQSEIATADTVIRRPHELRYVIQTPAKHLAKLKAAAPVQSIVNSFKDYGVTSFSVTLNERTLSDTFSLEIARAMAINDAVKGQLLDYQFSFLVEETSQQGLIQTVKGMYDIDKLLYTHVYEASDVIEASSSYQTIRSSEGYTVIGDSTSTPTASEYLAQIANYFSLTPNVKIQDFTSSRDLTDTDITYSDLISSLFSWTSQLPQRQINVFIRGGTLHCIQRGLEDSTFDISDLPHSRPTINRKLIRTLYNNTSSPSSESSSFGSSRNAGGSGDWTTEYYVEPEDIEISTLFSGTISFSDNGTHVSITYEEGLLRSEHSRTSNIKVDSSSTTDYDYKKIGGEYYLEYKRNRSTTIQYNGVREITVDQTKIGGGIKKTEDEDKTKIETNSTNKYFYKIVDGDNVYMCEEYEGNYKAEYDYFPVINKNTGDVVNHEWKLVDEETNDRRTFHTPVGNGWYATSVYLNGEPQGSTLSQGKPDNKVSRYTINEVQQIFHLFAKVTGPNPNWNGGGSGSASGYEIDDDDWRNRLSPINETSFPVMGADLLLELTEALYWLNRKTQETISVDIIDKIVNGVPTINHVVDFTERVILDGYEYFLVSNQIQFTPRSFIQKLQLVRWY